MQTLEDIRAIVHAEITHFRIRHAGQEFACGYLWFYSTTPERDGGIMVAEDRPGVDWEPVTPERLPINLSADDIVQSLTLRHILGRLPVLSLVN